ncbi:putative transposase [Kosakonia arachidis]|uniref:Putative transposase n=1 Tax=Kosakonia arachidis TaxID=551989 RepID=A0A1I7C7Y8_9ENTR|nr:putative transposase [Kosakonia arachidis]
MHHSPGYPTEVRLIRDNICCWPVRLLCRVLDVHPVGFYTWLQQPHSPRYQAGLRLTGQIKQFWLESGCVYGYRKIHLDLRDIGQQCGINRVCRLMKLCWDKEKDLRNAGGSPQRYF